MKDEISWVNPYIKKLNEYPGRIFRFEEVERDCQAVRSVLEGSSHVYCEIGSGSGGHLLELARRDGGALFFGFEIRFKRAVRTIEKAERDGVTGVYVLRTKAEIWEQIFPKASLDGVYVNFPDPWSKKRWEKHQILSTGLLESSSRLLKPGGFLSVKSDHGDYFHAFLKKVSENAQFVVEEQSDDLYESPYITENIPTEFENLFRSKGMPIYYAKLRLADE